MTYELPKGKYLVVGLGITGEVLIDFLLERGMTVAAYEELSDENFRKTKEKCAGKNGIEFYFGALPAKVFENLKGVFVSPGVPLTRPWNDEAKKRSIPVIGELELASWYLQGKIIAVTGTNGKSTTVSLLHEILKTGGFSSSLKGNIGSPLLTAVGEPPRVFCMAPQKLDAPITSDSRCLAAGGNRQKYYVVEASSYQLETIGHFHPVISVVLNVTADHLERYADMEAYAGAKARIFMNQISGDFFIYNADDMYCARMAREAPCKAIPFSLVNPSALLRAGRFDEGGFIDGDEIVIRTNTLPPSPLPSREGVRGRGSSIKEMRFSLSECSLQGLHNQENMLAAILAASIVGVDSAAITSALKDFKSLRHRLEAVGTLRGIRFYDDSKGTNVGAVVMSLASFAGGAATEKNVILLLGGRDKGGDYGPLIPLIRGKVKAVIVLGEAREKIARALEGVKPVHRTTTMKEAVEKSFEIGSAGDVVLLSPACSSFDQYKNYAERGDDFKKWVFHFGEKK
ncbi:MAG: UDP-N-acetylmuramoyl-L-alanine--D-glutamate ligase [Deltaproteobacteria bacterium]|nr:UDP-N-acetylmuramoyl-L-alanine--D-glutamate ligase [Deltaproteobacteria bacterium]